MKVSAIHAEMYSDNKKTRICKKPCGGSYTQNGEYTPQFKGAGGGISGMCIGGLTGLASAFGFAFAGLSVGYAYVMTALVIGDVAGAIAGDKLEDKIKEKLNKKI